MYLITTSLINSWKYYLKASDDSEQSKRTEFLTTLRRESIPTNEAMQAGIDFENAIFNQTLVDEPLPVAQNIIDIAKIVKGGLWQVRCKKEIEVDGTQFLLYGKQDVVKNNTIYDIKFTKNYEVGKYTDSIQHRIYMYTTSMPCFSYLIGSLKEEWYREDYFNHKGIEDEIKSTLYDFSEYLKYDKEAQQLYIKHWNAL